MAPFKKAFLSSLDMRRAKGNLPRYIKRSDSWEEGLLPIPRSHSSPLLNPIHVVGRRWEGDSNSYVHISWNHNSEGERKSVLWGSHWPLLEGVFRRWQWAEWKARPVSPHLRQGFSRGAASCAELDRERWSVVFTPSWRPHPSPPHSSVSATRGGHHPNAKD